MPTIAERFRSKFSAPTANGEAAKKPDWATTCLNCGAPLTSAFCADCGQRAVPPHPTVRELAGDAFVELSGWDGKFIDTFRLLLRRPGELTRAFIEGRRVRYIAPVRLYLTLSLIYFLIAASAPILQSPKAGSVSVGPINIGVTRTTTSSDAPAAPSAAQSSNASANASAMMTDEDRAAAVKDVATAPRFIRPILRRAVTDPVGFRAHLFEMMPRVLFVLVPILGAIIGLFYRRHHYPEHLYFALHLESFAFLVLTAAELVKFTHVFALSAAATVLAEVAVPVYAILALRRVYANPIGATLLKAVGISAVYLIIYGAATFGLIYYAAVAA